MPNDRRKTELFGLAWSSWGIRSCCLGGFGRWDVLPHVCVSVDEYPTLVSGFVKLFTYGIRIIPSRPTEKTIIRTITATMVVLSIQNYINGNFQAPLDATDDASSSSSSSLEVTNPATGDVIANVCRSSATDVDAAVQAAATAFCNCWRDGYTIKARAAILLKFHALVQEHADELADLIVKENGKNKTEVSLASMYLFVVVSLLYLLLAQL